MTSVRAMRKDQAKELREKRDQSTLIRDLMAHYGLSKAIIYRYLDKMIDQ